MWGKCSLCYYCKLIDCDVPLTLLLSTLLSLLGILLQGSHSNMFLYISICRATIPLQFCSPGHEEIPDTARAFLTFVSLSR